MPGSPPCEAWPSASGRSGYNHRVLTVACLGLLLPLGCDSVGIAIAVLLGGVKPAVTEQDRVPGLKRRPVLSLTGCVSKNENPSISKTLEEAKETERPTLLTILRSCLFSHPLSPPESAFLPLHSKLELPPPPCIHCHKGSQEGWKCVRQCVLHLL